MTSQRFLIIDGGSLENLIRSGGKNALDLLFKAADRVVIPNDVIGELPDDIRVTVNSWKSDSNGRVLVPSFQMPEGSPPKDLGDNAIRAFLKGNASSLYRVGGTLLL